MSEKKILQKITDRLRRFEEYEQKCSVLVFSLKESFDFGEDVLDAAGSIRRKEYIEKNGVLANLYNTFLNFCKDVLPDNRRDPSFLVVKYRLYLDSIEKMRIYPSLYVKTDDYIKREALYLLSDRHSEGEERFSDLFNSKMLISEYGSEIRLCSAWKKWLIWDGKRWKTDEGNIVYQMAINTIKKMYRRALENKTEDETLAMMEHAGRSEAARKIESMIRVTGWNRELNIVPDDLDRDPFVFNCRNGMIDLETGRLYPHEKKRMITRVSPVTYENNAECFVWKRFLKDIFGKNRELINFVQRVLGWALTGDNSSQAMFILYGNGANGKSTFINTVMKLMGDYATSTPTDTFMQKKGDQATNDIARLKGSRFVSAMEAEYGGRLAEAVIKRLTGNDVISARFLYGEFFDFLPTFKIFMATNHKPTIGGMDNAIWRRIRLVPFEVSFPEEKQDRKLSEKLNNELPGILSWIVEGTLKWRKEGLGNSPAVLEATNEYRFEMSAIESFLEEECIREENTMVKSLDLYNAYKKWCEENNERILSSRSFGMRLGETGIDKVRISTGYHWLEIGLKG